MATQQRTRPNCNVYSASAGKSTRVRTFDDIDSLEGLIEIMLRRWPNHRKDDWQLAIYYDGLNDLAKERGFECLKSAVRASFTRCNFLPEPPELRELMPEVGYVQPLKLHDPNCRDCRGEGWKPVPVPMIDGKTGRLDRRFMPCDCKAPSMPQPEPTPEPTAYHSVLKDAVEKSEAEHLGNESRRAAARAQARAALKTVTERMERERATRNNPTPTS
jgi:hypothetical protein